MQKAIWLDKVGRRQVHLETSLHVQKKSCCQCVYKAEISSDVFNG